MTKEKLKRLQDIHSAEERGRTYLNLSATQKEHRSKINCLLGNASELVSEATFEACWNLMKADAEDVLDKLKREFEKA